MSGKYIEACRYKSYVPFNILTSEKVKACARMYVNDVCICMYFVKILDKALMKCILIPYLIKDDSWHIQKSLITVSNKCFKFTLLYIYGVFIMYFGSQHYYLTMSTFCLWHVKKKSIASLDVLDIYVATYIF